jgi:triple functional domain protein
VLKRDLALDRISDPSIDMKLKDSAKSASSDDAKRRSARRKELVMQELLNSERSYIKDLTECIKVNLAST